MTWAYQSECGCGHRTQVYNSRWRLVLAKVRHDLRNHRLPDRSSLWVRR